MTQAIKKAFRISIGTSTAVNPNFVEAVVLEEHSFTAEISHTSGGFGSVDDETEIEIYNLGNNDFLNNEKLTGIRIQAGTNRDKTLRTVYEGDIKKVSVEKDGVEIITTLVCGSGSINKRQAVSNRTFFGGTPLEAIIVYVAGTMLIPLGVIDVGAATSVTTVGPYIANGFSSTILDKLCKQYELLWFVFNNELNIIPREASQITKEIDTKTFSVDTAFEQALTGAPPVEEVFSVVPLEEEATDIQVNKIPTYIITPRNVIGTVENQKDIINVSSKDEDSKHTGLKIRTFLIPELRMGFNIRLEGFTGEQSNVNGDYRIEDLVVELDSWESGPWDTVMELGEL